MTDSRLQHLLCINTRISKARFMVVEGGSGEGARLTRKGGACNDVAELPHAEKLHSIFPVLPVSGPQLLATATVQADLDHRPASLG